MVTDRQEADRSFWVVARVTLREALRTDGGVLVDAYYVNIGVACVPDELRDVVDRAITDGSVDWSRSEWHARFREDVADPDIRSRIDFKVRRGVWYRSGRVLVPAA